MRRLTGAARNLVLGVGFVLVVMACAITAYVERGWSFGDALYFTVLTVFTVGYDEVQPIDTPILRGVTIALIVLGCSGTIFVTGALVQFITFNQINEIFGTLRMKNRLEDMRGHAIICGYGRIGLMLARELKAGGKRLVVLERNPARQAQALADEHVCLLGDATEEQSLRQAGIERAAVLASVLPDDALNVFITLSARSLNTRLTIIARGEAASTERKLLQAGANRVVMPTQIGAERIAEIILFPELSDQVRASRAEASASLRQLGLEIELIITEPDAAFCGLTVSEIERQAGSGFLILSVQAPGSTQAGAAQTDAAPPSARILAGYGVTVAVRSGQTVALAGFRAAA
ncbi:potassium channel family protein [Lichenicoccus sp.]|uniref:potassium channel family protein n=1 Tax=Lichenicoccus sp. TaxID=2781899 RepID=UPI003D0C2A56